MQTIPMSHLMRRSVFRRGFHTSLCLISIAQKVIQTFFICVICRDKIEHEALDILIYIGKCFTHPMQEKNSSCQDAHSRAKNMLHKIWYYSINIQKIRIICIKMNKSNENARNINILLHIL